MLSALGPAPASRAPQAPFNILSPSLSLPDLPKYYSTSNGDLEYFDKRQGHLQTSAIAVQGGWEITTDIHHSKGEKACLLVALRAYDPVSDTCTWFPVSVPFDGDLEGEGGVDELGLSVTRKSFFLSLTELNAWLAQEGGRKADGSAKLQFKPGDALSVDCVLGNRHEAGGRYQGLLVTPPLPTLTTAVQLMSATTPIVRPGQVAKAQVDGEVASGFKVKLPQAVINKYPKLFPADATLTTRRTQELTFEPRTLDEQSALIDTLRALAKAPLSTQSAELEKVFGDKGWSVAAKKPAAETVHFRDFVVDPTTTLPVDWPVSQQGASLHFGDRSVDVIFDGAAMNPFTGITTRVRHSLAVREGLTGDPASQAELASFLENERAPYNPWQAVRLGERRPSPQSVTTDVLSQQLDRHAFVFSHESGITLHVACDFVETASRTQLIEPLSVKGKSLGDRYGHWRSKFASFDETPGIINRATFADEGRDGVPIEVDVELSVDDEGCRSVAEVCRIKSARVHIDMMHTQFPAQDAAQEATALAADASSVESASAIAAIMRGFSESTTFAPPSRLNSPRESRIESLRAAPAFEQMAVAATKLREWASPSGGSMKGLPAAEALHTLGAMTMRGPPVGGAFDVNNEGIRIDSQRGAIVVEGVKIEPSRYANFPSSKSIRMKVLGYSITLPVRGDETCAEVRDAIVGECAKFIAYKPVVVATKGRFYDEAQSRYVTTDRYAISLEPREALPAEGA
jgi:hypothetical protein